MNELLTKKLTTLPYSPGVYFHKAKNGEVIYVGKAAVLKNRVRQYFQHSKTRDAKTHALVQEIYDTDWIETDSEIDALFLESEMIKRYMPRYNILLRDDKSQLFVRIDMRSMWPHVSFTRNPADDGAEYIGPFYNGFAVKKALRYLRKVLPYFTKPDGKQTSKLDEDLGLSPRREAGAEVYKQNLRTLISYIKGNRVAIAKELEAAMKHAAQNQDFETATVYRNKLQAMKELQRRVMFGDSEHLDISKDMALNDLAVLLKLTHPPKRIDGFDISHMSGSNVVASMVVFSNGIADKAKYRKFKMRVQRNDDFANMNEAISRRFSPKNVSQWGLPELVLIDGGKGQLDAALQARDALGITVPFIGLAKKQEQIMIDAQRSYVTIQRDELHRLDGFLETTQHFITINLPTYSHVVKLLQRVRDESHRFAVGYHSVLKRHAQTASTLDDVPGIGPVTRRKLIAHFGSLRAITQANEDEIAKVVSKRVAKTIKQVL
ncbi:excinuclease ABC subunit UvrC [Candidatus Saccharibacteria bacterium]|nr:excinuclease ABC subunit UvrC [Candidatus Saccharibacteria bacterium]